MRLIAIEWILIGLIAFVVFNHHSNKSFEDSSVKNVPETPQKDLALEISLEEFKTAYNKIALSRNVPQLQVKDFEYGNGKDRDTFCYKFIQDFYLFGKIDDETGYIKNLSVAKTLRLKGDDRKAEFQAAAIVFLMIVQTLSPELNSHERAEILSKFADTSKKYIKVDSEKIEYENALLENGKTVMFSATIKENPVPIKIQD